MNSQTILALAAQSPAYVFGSKELDELHTKHMGRDNRYTCDLYYVVIHPGADRIPTFRTLNHLIYGQVVPEILDIPNYQDARAELDNPSTSHRGR